VVEKLSAIFQTVSYMGFSETQHSPGLISETGDEGSQLPLGRKIGRVEELFTGGDGRPKHVRARLGPFGLGMSVLIPVAAVVVDGERRVVVLW
jgi:hypothetical protein